MSLKRICNFFKRIWNESKEEVKNKQEEVVQQCDHDWKLVYANSEITNEQFYVCTKCKQAKTVT